MPQSMTVTAPNGKTLTITGDRVPNEAELQEIFKKAGVETAAAAPAAPAPTDPNTMGTFARHMWDAVNPMSAGQLLPFPEKLGGAGWDAPVKAWKGFRGEQERVRQESADAFANGDYATGVRKGVDWLLSAVTAGGTLGMDKSSDHAVKGEYAASAGDALGIAATAVAPEAVKLVRESGPAQRVASAADASATSAVVDTLTPKGSSKAIQRTAKQAEAVAPAVLRGTDAVTPSGLISQITDRLDDAGANLDAAYAAIPKTKPYPTKPILSKLQAARDALNVRGTGGTTTSSTVAAHAAALDQAISEVKSLGNLTSIDNLVKLRNQWKGPARDAFTPALNPNFQTIRASSQGWADAWGAVQETLTDLHPNLKPLNADYRIWKQAAEVAQALEDQARTKPTVGRTMMAEGLGAAAGAATGGVHGIAAGAIIGPLIERGLNAKVAPAVKLVVARQLGNLADAIRSGQTTQIEKALGTLRPLLISTSSLERGAPTPAPARADREEPAAVAHR